MKAQMRLRKTFGFFRQLSVSDAGFVKEEKKSNSINMPPPP